MRSKKMKVFAIALAICLVAILSLGSLAWFTSSSTVTNKFKIAESDDDTPDDIFSVGVWEYTEQHPNDKTPTGETYPDVLPGDELKKEPHVENTGYYDQYIRVIVTVSDAAAWKTALGVAATATPELSQLVSGYDTTIWDHTSATVDTTADTITYVMYLTNKLTAGNDVKVFEKVVIPQSLTQEQAAAFDNEFQIVVKAQAVQTENVGSSAYEAFQTVGMAITD